MMRLLNTPVLFLAALISFSPFYSTADESAGVKTTRVVHIPIVKGMWISHGIPSELTPENYQDYVNVSMSTEAVNDFLTDLELSPVTSFFTEKSVHPRCETTEVNKTAGYNLVLSDANWLHAKGRWCRFKRFFGGCKPESLEDVIEMAQQGYVRIERQDAESVSEKKTIKYLENPACVASLPEQQIQQYDRLTKCVTYGTPYLEECQKAFGAQSVAASEDEKTWTLSGSFALGYEDRQVIDSEYRVHYRTKQLKALQVGRIHLEQVDTDLWQAKFKMIDLVNTFDDKSPNVVVKTIHDVTAKGKVNAERPVTAKYVHRHVFNFPAQIELEKKDIVGFEELVDYNSGKSLLDMFIEEVCIETSADYHNEFDQFLCKEKVRELEGLSKRTQIRLRFIDDRGIERLMTWERAAPIQQCQLANDGWAGHRQKKTLDCGDAMAEKADWERWFYDPSDRIKKFVFDPVNSDDVYLQFSNFLTFLPQAEGAADLKVFVEPQTRTLKILDYFKVGLDGPDVDRMKRDANRNQEN